MAQNFTGNLAEARFYFRLPPQERNRFNRFLIGWKSGFGEEYDERAALRMWNDNPRRAATYMLQYRRNFTLTLPEPMEAYDLSLNEKRYLNNINDSDVKREFEWFVRGWKHHDCSKYGGNSGQILIDKWKKQNKGDFLKWGRLILRGIVEHSESRSEDEIPAAATGEPHLFDIGQDAQGAYDMLPSATAQHELRLYLAGAKFYYPVLAKYQGELAKWWDASENDESNFSDAEAEIVSDFWNTGETMWLARATPSDLKGHFYDTPAPAPTVAGVEHAREEMAKLGSPGEWSFTRTLYQNKSRNDFHRIVHLFLKNDKDGNIDERLVIKIQGYNRLSTLELFLGKETNAHIKVSTQGCPHILNCRGYSIRPRSRDPHLSYIYLDYAPFGNLRQLIESYKTHYLNKQVPEAFIWMVFRGLAEALYVLTTGKLATLDSPQDHVKNEHLQTAPNWEKLVHMDIKPLNVVLAEARTQYPVFKTPQLIDFGAARTEDQFLKLSRDENATRQASGTKGYRPPEQHHELNEHTGKLIDVRADIHNVGLIILSLIAKQAVKLDNPHDESAKRPQSNACYSEQLATLAADCVNLDPEQRPTLAKLLHRTQEGFTAYTDVYGDVAQKQMDELDRYHKMDYVTHLGADEFAVGLPMPRKRGSESANHNWSPKRPRTGEGGVAGRVREGTLRLDIDSDFQDEVDDELEYGSEGREDGSEKWEDDVERKEAEQEELGDEPEESGDEPEVPEVPEVPEKP